MAKRGGGKMKAKLEPPEPEEKQKSVILLTSSDDEEANEDLSLKIVETAKLRESKRNREEDEFEASEGVRAASSVINLSSESSDEVEQNGGGGGGTVVAHVEVKKKKKKNNKKKKNASVKVEEEEEEEEEEKVNGVAVLNSEQPMEAGKPVETEAGASGAKETGDLVYTVHSEKSPELVDTNGHEISDNVVQDNAVLRKLLRGPRYFDPPNSSYSTCYNCGEEGHIAVNCTAKKRKKPCFVCGSFEHGVRQCTQGKECYICNKSGHRAKDCLEKNQRSSLVPSICLKCGESGHDMFSCSNNYDPEDLKEIRCYVCKKHGHLCCVDTIDAGMGEISCYNCGQSGHSGAGCAKQRGETSGAGTPTLCYKCGEEGHFARGCTKYAKSEHRNDRVAGFSTPIKKSKKKARNSQGYQSVPPELSKACKKRSVEFEGRDFTTPRKPKRRGGWMTDDPGNLPNREFKPNFWRSPATPPTNNFNRYSNSTPGGHFSNSGSHWSNPHYNYGTPNSHGSSNYYQHNYTASRFGNSGGGWGRHDYW